MIDSSKTRENKLQATPLSGRERIVAVDVLRGFAIFGILLVNIYGFSGLLLSPQSETDRLDRLVMILVVLLAQAKFYSLFSFLFGWGMSVQMQRVVERGGSFVRLYLRRMLVLLLIGLVHGLFVWTGDILTAYAVLGSALLLFRKSSTRTLLIGVALFLLLSIVMVLPGGFMDDVRAFYAQATQFMRSGNLPPQSILGRGSYGEIGQRRMGDFISSQSWFIYWLGNVFAMMLLGLYVGKRRIIQDVDGHRPLIRKTLWLGLLIGLLFNGISLWTMLDANAVQPQYQRFLRVSTRTIGAPALMLFYASGLLLLMQKERWRQRLAPLAPVGRMALSNYLLQSVLATLLFYGYGLGLYGQITPTVALIIVVIIYFLQIRLSEWWMERYRFGPAEWLWRSLTYWQPQPVRRQHLADRSAVASTLSSLRALAMGLSPSVYLVIIWIFLIAWAGALFAWQSRLSAQTGSTPFALFSEATPAVATAPARPVTTRFEVDALATPVVQSLPYRPSPAAKSGDVSAMTDSLDVDRAMEHIEALSSEAFTGRLAGSPGGTAAGDYIAEMFARYRLQPAGQDGTFFQTFPVTYTTMSEVPQIEVILPDGESISNYELYESFAPVVLGYAGEGAASGRVHWVNQCRTADFADLLLVDQIVLCKPELGSEALVTSSRLALEYGASGLLLLSDQQDRPADFADRYQEVWVPETIPVLRVYPSLVEDLLAGSDLTIDDLLGSDTSMVLQTEARLVVETDETARFSARNVLGVLPGREPAFADEIVIVGAHYDHMGQGPDGTYWPGANDNASGVSAILEIARSWQELGFVPRRTVLFAAWDAKEWGLFGSRFYVERPSYPLEKTVGSIQLDMVGAGPSVLAISGDQRLAQQLLDAADASGVEATISNLGRSDHVPFLEADVPATLLIWHSEEEPVPHYHRPVDLPQVIEPKKLASVLQVTNNVLLDLAESDPAIQLLVSQRAQAAVENDLATFLSTSPDDQSTTESRWFADLQALEPVDVTMSVEEIAFRGSDATANVSLEIVYGDGAEPISMVQPVQFSHNGLGWQWAGPALAWYRTPEDETDRPGSDVQVVIGYPQGVDAEPAPLARLVEAEYADVARKLGLPEQGDVQFTLMPDAEALQFSTALSLPADETIWVEPGLVKIVYSPEISQSQTLVNAVVQLVLADAGITEQAAPWLWQGLPVAWQATHNLEAVHEQYLPELDSLLNDEAVQIDLAASWAAVEYLLQEVGWDGAGSLVQEFGQACEVRDCETPAGIDQAMTSAFQMNIDAFHAAWQQMWRTRLNEIQASLNRLLVDRAEAVLSGDEEAFLATIDPDDAYVMASERRWFDRLRQSPPEAFQLSGQPITLYDNGDVLARVNMDYELVNQLQDRLEDQVALEILFRRTDEGLKWAGPAHELMIGNSITVRFPEGRDELAQDLLREAEQSYASLARTLQVASPLPVVLELYPERVTFQTAIGPAFPTAGWLPAWSETGGDIKLHLGDADSVDAYRSALVNQLARYLLYQKGIENEWLLKGISAQLSIALGGRDTQRALATNLLESSTGDAEPREIPFLSMPTDEMLSSAAWLATTAQAWDSAGYLIAAEGWPSVLAFIERVSDVQDLPVAFAATFDRSLADFEQSWRIAASNGYVRPGWIEAVGKLDGQAAFEHVMILGGNKLAGRQAGTPGAEIAAGYIARRFAEFGLQPAGDMHKDSYYQTFPITVTVWDAEPALQVIGDSSPYQHRVDFLPLYATDDASRAEGELVWLGAPGEQDLDLSGKIALLMANQGYEEALNLAVTHQASGLLLMGFKNDDTELYAKQPLSLSMLADIPALELTAEGTLRLLERLDLRYDEIQALPPGTPLGLEVRLSSSISTENQVMTTNVLGLLPGSDPLLSEQAIVIGAHYDHVGDDRPGYCSPQSGDCASAVRYSGLNDNASGIAVMLEIAHLWQEISYRPKHSVLFVAWGAQEGGQLGSRRYVQAPTWPLSTTLAMFQLDGVGGGDGFYPGLNGQPGSDELPIHYTTLAAGHLEQKIVVTASENESDHLPFREQGVPSLLVSWRLASENNLPDDLADGVSPERMTTSGRLVALSLMMLAR